MLSEHTADEVRELLARTRRVLEGRPTVERLTPPLTVIGDIHGDLSALGAVVRLAEEEGATPVILGDFIDRAPDGLNVETAITVMELAASGRAVVLRGNHENFLHFHLGPYLELAPDLLIKYEDDTDLLQNFGETFLELPLVALTDSVLMTHAGIPPLPFKDIDPKDADITVPFTWADPESKPHHKWYTFSEADVKAFMTNTRRKIFIRGHTATLNRIVVYDNVLTLQTTKVFRDAGAGGINVAMLRDEVETIEQLEILTLDGRWNRTAPVYM